MISALQYERLRRIAAGECEGPVEQFLDAVASPEELLFLSTIPIWEFDSGYRYYDRFLNHRYCDVSLAFYFFWSCSPAYLYRKRKTGHSLDVEETVRLAFCDGVFDLVVAWSGLSGHYSFDPRSHANGATIVNWDYVPSLMKQRTKGPSIDPAWFLARLGMERQDKLLPITGNETSARFQSRCSLLRGPDSGDFGRAV